jgi:hypothetical protein
MYFHDDNLIGFPKFITFNQNVNQVHAHRGFRVITSLIDPR